MISKTAITEIIKAHMNGEDKNTKAVLSDVMESVNELEALEQESTYYPPCQDCNKKMDEIRRIYDKIKEQEPCDNAISRSDMLDAIGHGTTYTSEELQRIIQNLPPVNPQPLEGFIDGVHAMGYREGYKDAQKQKSGKWIPVIERLPEEYGEYLITWKNPKYPKTYIGICECEITDVYDHEHNRFEVEWLFDGYITTAYPDSYVIAWRPLPEPYEPQESEEQTK